MVCTLLLHCLQKRSQENKGCTLCLMLMCKVFDIGQQDIEQQIKEYMLC